MVSCVFLDKGKGYLDNGDCFDDFFLVHLGAWSVEVSDDMCHTSLVSGKGSEVDWIGSEE